MFVEIIIEECLEELNSIARKKGFAGLNSTEGWNLTLQLNNARKNHVFSEKGLLFTYQDVIFNRKIRCY